MASFNYVPSDIVFEVLTRTGLQALGSCRIVCKDWNHLTYNSNFDHVHREKTKTVSGYFIQSMNNNKWSSEFVTNDEHGASNISISFLPAATKIEASCKQGLLFCVCQDPPASRNSRSSRNYNVPDQYYVCKPSTKQWRAIPNPKTRYQTCSSGIMISKLKPLQYKIVRFSKPKYRRFMTEFCYNLRCEVFDSRIWRWQVVKEINLQDSELLLNHPAVSANGALHWFTDKDRIISFNIDEESSSVSSIPEHLHGGKNYSHKYLAEYEGRLALICSATNSANNRMGIWIRDPNHRWSNKETVDLEEHTSIPEAFYNADVVIMRDFYKIVYHNFMNSSYSSVKLRNTQEIFSSIDQI